MNIEDVEQIIGKTLTPEQRAMYESRLPYVLDYINEDCGGRFRDPATKQITLPDGVKIGAVILAKAMLDNPGVSSKSLADMSTSYQEGGATATARSYWRAYRRVKFF